MSKLVVVFSSNAEQNRTGTTPTTVVILADTLKEAWSMLLVKDRWPFDEKRWWDCQHKPTAGKGVAAEVAHE